MERAFVLAVFQIQKNISVSGLLLEVRLLGSEGNKITKRHDIKKCQKMLWLPPASVSVGVKGNGSYFSPTCVSWEGRGSLSCWKLVSRVIMAVHCLSEQGVAGREREWIVLVELHLL